MKNLPLLVAVTLPVAIAALVAPALAKNHGAIGGGEPGMTMPPMGQGNDVGWKDVERHDGRRLQRHDAVGVWRPGPAERAMALPSPRRS